MWQKDTICNVNSNFPVLYNTSSIPFMCNSSRPLQPQLQLAMNWFRLIQQIRNIPQASQIPHLSPGIPFLEKRPKHKPSKLLYHYNNKLTPLQEKISKSKSNSCRFLSTKEKSKSKSIYGNKFLTTFKITSDCHNNLSRIPNKIGPFECKLCGTLYNGAVQLANHRCPQILRIEHRCPDCHKIFNCPANLASHRRWHKPKTNDPFIDMEESDQKLCVKSDGSLTSFNIESIINVKMSQVIPDKSLEIKNNFQKQHFCHLCSKSLLSTLDLENHMLDHLLENCYK